MEKIGYSVPDLAWGQGPQLGLLLEQHFSAQAVLALL